MQNKQLGQKSAVWEKITPTLNHYLGWANGKQLHEPVVTLRGLGGTLWGLGGKDDPGQQLLAAVGHLPHAGLHLVPREGWLAAVMARLNNLLWA